MAQAIPGLSVVIIDNGSTDRALDAVARSWPGVTILRNPTNTGFTGGQNRGMAHALEQGADFVLLLNQDATLLSDCIQQLVTTLKQDDRVGLASPVVYYKQHPSDPQFSGSWLLREEMRLFHSHDRDMYERQAAVAPDSICLWGTALMIRCEVLRRIGMLDGRFFAYYEDSDLCIRASRQGWLSSMCFSAGVLHEGHRNRRTRPPHYFYFMARNEMLFWKKVLGVKGVARAMRVSAARALGEAGNMRDAGLHAESIACITGMWDGLRRRYGPFRADRAAPRWILRFALSHPFLLSNLLEGRFRQIMEAFSPRRSRPP